MKFAIASTVLFLLLNLAVSDAHKWKKWKKAYPVQEDPWEPETRVADPWPEEREVPEEEHEEPEEHEYSKDGCEVVYDDVWEEKCKTVYNDTKCHSFKIPKCKVHISKKCQNKQHCKKVWEKKCKPHQKDVCKTHHDKECKEVWEEVCKDVKIRVVPDVVKYDYPEVHSSPLTYDSYGGGGGGGGGSNSPRVTRSVAKKLLKLQDKIDHKFDKAYKKL